MKYYFKNFKILIIIDRIRFCFYGTNQIAYNLPINQTTDSSELFLNKIFYSLLPNSVNILNIEPYDGCTKISSLLNLEENWLKYLTYSVI